MAYHSFLVEPISCHAWNKDRTRELTWGETCTPGGWCSWVSHGPHSLGLPWGQEVDGWVVLGGAVRPRGREWGWSLKGSAGARGAEGQLPAGEEG